jgi:spore maturation protein CgeB
MIGPFHGTSNDAHITRDVTEINCSLLDWCEKGDTMVVDRSFRDVINTFEQLGYEPQVRSYLKKGEKQHTFDDVNKARLVTKLRWTVESYHARIKQFLFMMDEFTTH